MKKTYLVAKLFSLLTGALASFRLFVLGTVILSFSACSVYRVAVSQGVPLYAEMVAEVQVGMSKSDVQKILGSNALIDPFSPNRWSYVYLKPTGSQSFEKQILQIYFDDQNRVSKLLQQGEFVKEDRKAALITK